MDSTAVERRAAAHREHVAWLRDQHDELESHRSQQASLRIEDDEDFAVGSEGVGFQFASVPAYAVGEEEEARYRSLSIPPSGADQSADVEVVEETLVYRSLPTLARQSSEQSSSSDADASWLAAGRPPLLQRQCAFNYGRDNNLWLTAQQ